MFKIMILKLKSKKWMTISLMTGIILLIATVSSFPMYKSAAIDKMLTDSFRDELKETGKWPLTVKFNTSANKDTGRQSIYDAEALVNEFYKNMGVTEKETVLFYSTQSTVMQSEMGRSDINGISLKPAFFSGLENHVVARSGNVFSESGYTDDGAIEVMISEETMISADVLVNETFELTKIKDDNGKPVRVKIIGVFGVADSSDFYWQLVSKKASSLILMKEDVFRNVFMAETRTNLVYSCMYSLMFEYADLSTEDIPQIMEYTEELELNSEFSKNMTFSSYMSILEEFNRSSTRTEVTLFMLTVPVLFLLGAFIFMVCNKIYESDANEISVMKSRGASSAQLFFMYLMQNVLITVISSIFGVMLGFVFAGVLGSTESFMEFDTARSLDLHLEGEALIYTACGAVLAILIMTIPSLKYSRITIVNFKQQKALKRRTWWKKIYLDVICIAVSLYGYYSADRTVSDITGKTDSTGAVDPLLYVSSSLMIVGLGLLFIRLQPYLVNLIYLVGKKLWHPASYLSFKENRKNSGSVEFIILFMIISISLGIFNAVVARTLLQNAVDDAEYLAGSDIIVKEQWKDNSYLAEEGIEELTYYEPDLGKYDTLDILEKYTKVIYDNRITVQNGSGNFGATLMGIHTKEFGETTSLPAGLNEKRYREYLNLLALNEKGALVSSTFKEVYGVNAGDTVTFKDASGNSMYLVILDFFDYWPGYEKSTVTTDASGESVTTDNFLIVANYHTLTENWGQIQYEVWMKLKDNADTDEFYAWITENNVTVTKYNDKTSDVNDVINAPLLQGTNGILTMGFLVTMLLCAAGYLIYWIMAIKQKELMFGILRAGGMHKGEIMHFLINEQLFTGGFAIVVGILIGNLTVKMFVPALQKAASAGAQVLPMKVVTGGSHITKLYIVIMMMVVLCIAVLSNLVQRLNITKALKLGED